jgi:multisubunit Na+/H+ antiporter MnhB subunit
MTGSGLAGTAFDLVLAALIFGAALAAMAGSRLFGAVVFFLIYGVFVSMAWLRLDAIDVAIAEAAIGAGLTGVLLIGAVAQLARLPEAPDRPAPVLPRALAALVAAGVSVGLGWAFLTLPEPAGLQDAVAERIADSGVENPVTAVLLNFRAWDTLLESIVLLAALIGSWALADAEAWGGRPGLRHHARPGGVLASFGRVLPPVGLLVGVYLVWVGSSQPGGAFQGGTVLAAVGLLVAMAGLIRAPRVESFALRAALVAGPAVFLAVGLVGALAGGFLWLPPDHAKTLILCIEIMLTVSIAVTLALLVLGPPTQEQQP